MPPILSIIGRSGSGKTTLVEKLIGALAAMGYRVSALKHTHQSFAMDREGSDSRRYKLAGAIGAGICNDRLLGLVSDAPSPLPHELAMRYFSDADLLIIEGMKEAALFKMEVVGESDEEPLYRSGAEVRAVISDKPLSAVVPVFHRDDIDRIAAFVVRNILNPPLS